MRGNIILYTRSKYHKVTNLHRSINQSYKMTYCVPNKRLGLGGRCVCVWGGGVKSTYHIKIPMTTDEVESGE